MSKYLDITLIAMLAGTPALAGPLGLGREAQPGEIAAWDVNVMPDGTGLPEGSGDVTTGEEIFLEKCAACHGDFAEGLDNWPALAGGEDTLDRKDPVKTVGSYWPHLSTLWDYVHRSMPFGEAQVLTADETYAITAYILYSNYLVEDDFTLSKDNFADIELPNAGGFIVDDRPETEYPLFTTEACMENCKDSVEITMHASVLDVTPDDPDDGPDADNAAGEGANEAQTEAAAGDATEAETPEAAAVEAGGAETVDPVAAEPETTAPEKPVEQAAAAEPDPELVAAGEKVFAKCKACHMVGDDAKNRAGPVLNGVMGRVAGTYGDYKYSSAMIEAGENGLTWTANDLAAFLQDPRGTVPKTKMSFGGIKDQQDLDAIAAYLNTFKE